MSPRAEDALLLWMVIVIGVIPVVGAFLGATPWGVQPTIGILMMLAGIVELIRERRR